MGLYDSYYQGVYQQFSPSVYQRQQLAAWLVQQQIQQEQARVQQGEPPGSHGAGPSHTMRTPRFPRRRNPPVPAKPPAEEKEYKGSGRATPTGTFRYEAGLLGVKAAKKHFERIGYRVEVKARPLGPGAREYNPTASGLVHRNRGVPIVEGLPLQKQPPHSTSTSLEYAMNPDQRLTTLIDKKLDEPSVWLEESFIEPVNRWVMEQVRAARRGDRIAALGVGAGTAALVGLKFVQGAYEGSSSIVAPWRIAEGGAALGVMAASGELPGYYARNPLELVRLTGAFVGGYYVGAKLGRLYTRARIARQIMRQQKADMRFLETKGAVETYDYRPLGSRVRSILARPLHEFGRFREAWGHAGAVMRGWELLSRLPRPRIGETYDYRIYRGWASSGPEYFLPPREPVEFVYRPYRGRIPVSRIEPPRLQPGIRYPGPPSGVSYGDLLGSFSGNPSDEASRSIIEALKRLSRQMSRPPRPPRTSEFRPVRVGRSVLLVKTRVKTARPRLRLRGYDQLLYRPFRPRDMAPRSILKYLRKAGRARITKVVKTASKASKTATRSVARTGMARLEYRVVARQAGAIAKQAAKASKQLAKQLTKPAFRVRQLGKLALLMGLSAKTRQASEQRPVVEMRKVSRTIVSSIAVQRIRSVQVNRPRLVPVKPPFSLDWYSDIIDRGRTRVSGRRRGRPRPRLRIGLGLSGEEKKRWRRYREKYFERINPFNL